MKLREAKSNFAVIAAAEQLCDGEGCYLCRHPARIRGGRRKFLAWKTQHSYCDNILRQLENRMKDAAWEYSWLRWWISFTLTYLFPRARCTLVFVQLFSKSTSPGVTVLLRL